MHAGELPPEIALVDAGLSAFNDAAAPLHEVRSLACLARDGQGQVVGGAIGRRWGRCCELLQLWVEEAQRRQGIATQLIRAFEQGAREQGCTHFYLETFSFQAPALYLGLGYRVAYARHDFPHGIVKFHLTKGHEPDDAALGAAVSTGAANR